MMASGKPTPTELMKALRKDRLIDITVGAASTPFQVQQFVLEGASEWFAKALKRGAFVEGKDGKIHFPEDDGDAWAVLVYWMTRREFQADPYNDDGILLCAKCWVLGHKYDIRRFQDEAMMKLIRHFDAEWLNFEEDLQLNHILEICPPESELKRIFAEEIVDNIHHGPNKLTWEIVGRLSSGSFITELGEAQAKMVGNSQWRFHPRLALRRGEKVEHRPLWTHYMVGDKIDCPIERDEED